MRLFTLFRLEALKLTHRKVFWIAFLALGLVAAMFLWGFREIRFDRIGRASLMMGINLDHMKNGFLCAEFAVWHTFMVLLPIFSSVIGGHLIASEAKEGTLRAVLIRPVGRIELGAVKLLLALAYLASVNVFFTALMLGLALPIHGMGDLLTLYMVRGSPPMLSVVPPDEAIFRFGMACLLAAAAMLPVIALAFLFSTLFDNPVVATVGSLTTFLIFQIFHEISQGDEVSFFKWMEPYLFPHYMACWRKAFQPQIPWKAIAKDLGGCFAFGAGFAGLGLGWFRWKDIRS